MQIAAWLGVYCVAQEMLKMCVVTLNPLFKLLENLNC